MHRDRDISFLSFLLYWIRSLPALWSERDTISIFQGCLPYKYPCKNSLEQRAGSSSAYTMCRTIERWMENCLLTIRLSITGCKKNCRTMIILASDHESVTLVPIRKTMNVYHSLYSHISSSLCVNVAPILSIGKTTFKAFNIPSVQICVLYLPPSWEPGGYCWDLCA